MKLLFIVMAGLCSLGSLAQSKKTAPLTTIVEMISNSLAKVDRENTTNVELASVTASFTVSKTVSSGFSLNIWIFRIGRATERNNLRRVTLLLNKSDARRTQPIAKGSDELTAFINAALGDFQRMNDLQLLKDLDNREVTLEVGLTVKRDNNAGGEYSIGIFTLGAEAGRGKEQGHTLTLTFKKKSS